MVPKNPIVVAGMHRSGTSMAASILAAGGVDMGQDLLPADAANPPGYFEERAFLEFNRHLLFKATAGQVGGHRDWGWTPEESLDAEQIAAASEEALALLETRKSDSHSWGWKDPRNTLLLGFWQSVLAKAGCEPGYLLVYRFPWDVADSMRRLGFDLFLRNPSYAQKIWRFYNRHLLDFYLENPGRCLLVSANSISRHASRFESLIEERFGVSIPASVGSVTEKKLWKERGRNDPLFSLTAFTSAASVELLRELERNSDLPSGELWPLQAEAPRRAERIQTEDNPSCALTAIIICHNHGEFVLETIASVERAQLDGAEILIVDNASSEPDSITILAELRSRYRVLEQANCSTPNSWNLGIAMARGRCILILDAGDALAANFARSAIEILDVDVAAGAVYGDRLEFGMRRGRVGTSHPSDPAQLEDGCFSEGAVFRKIIWNEYGGFCSAPIAEADRDFWAAAVHRGWLCRGVGFSAFDRLVRPLDAEAAPVIPVPKAKPPVRHPGSAELVRVSFIIPCYLQARYLSHAVRSALGQLGVKVEVVVVDDGSPDDPLHHLGALAEDPRVRYIRQANAGLPAARNRGIQESAGEYLSFLDADDWLGEHSAAELAEVLRSDSRLGFAYSDLQHVFEEESPPPSAADYSVGASRRVTSGDILPSLLIGGYFTPHCALVRRAALEDAGRFDESLGGHADWDLWIRITVRGWLAQYVDKRLAFYRLHGKNMSLNKAHMTKTQQAALAKLYRRYPEQSAAATQLLMRNLAEGHAANMRLIQRLGEVSSARQAELERNDRIFREQRQWIATLDEAKAWHEEQSRHWASEAARLSEIVSRQSGILAQMRPAT